MKGSRITPRLFFVILPLLSMGCDKPIEQNTTPPQPRLVKTQTIDGSSQTNWREFPGVVDSARKADLGFRIAGKLDKLLAKESDIVTAGQLLAQLDPADQKIQLQSRQAEYDQANSDFERGNKLIEKNLISQSDYAKLKAQQETARAALDTARQNLEYTELKAPFGGRIAQRHVDNFEEVSVKQTIFTLQDQSHMTIKVDVPESVMIRVNRDAKREVHAIFDAIPGKQFPLRLSEAATQANENSNTFTITFALPEIKGYNILPGMSVTVRGSPNPSQNKSPGRFHIPAHAVLEDGEGRYVYIVEDIKADHGVVQRRAVQTGALSNLGMEITAGLEPGITVVTAGMSKMHSGLEVRLAAETKP